MNTSRLLTDSGFCSDANSDPRIFVTYQPTGLHFRAAILGASSNGIVARMLAYTLIPRISLVRTSRFRKFAG